MGFTACPERFKPGARSIPAAKLNASHRLLERLANFRGGHQTVWSPAGPLLGREGTLIRLGMTGSQQSGGQAVGIPAKDSNGIYGADVTDASLIVSAWDSSTSPPTYTAQLQTWSTRFQGFNLSSQPVAANTLTIYELLWGLWVCTWEDCPASSGG